jgi:hypothetical protein
MAGRGHDEAPFVSVVPVAARTHAADGAVRVQSSTGTPAERLVAVLPVTARATTADTEVLAA